MAGDAQVFDPPPGLPEVWAMLEQCEVQTFEIRPLGDGLFVLRLAFRRQRNGRSHDHRD